MTEEEKINKIIEEFEKTQGIMEGEGVGEGESAGWTENDENFFQLVLSKVNSVFQRIEEKYQQKGLQIQGSFEIEIVRVFYQKRKNLIQKSPEFLEKYIDYIVIGLIIYKVYSFTKKIQQIQKPPESSTGLSSSEGEKNDYDNFGKNENR